MAIVDGLCQDAEVKGGTTVRAVVAALVAGVLAAGLLAPPATAGTRATPGNFTGYAFDTCDAPSQRAMNAWLRSSTYWGVGIYIAGMNRACEAQPNLDRRWVRQQSRRGWRLLPLVVGRQASCSPPGYYLGRRISAKPRDHYAKARSQGRAAAESGVRAARRLGIGRGSVLWYDLEHFDLTRTKCRRSSMAFTSAWSFRLHQLGYRSGFYSSASSGIRMVDQARRNKKDNHTLPQYLWIAEWNGRPTLGSAYLTNAGWWPHRRVHQYRGGHDEKHGGVRINIDSNYLSTGKGTVAGRAKRHCGSRIAFERYPRLERGDRGGRVRAAQCLLKEHRYYRGKVHGKYTRAVAKSVRRLQADRTSRRPSGVLTRASWTALLSKGRTPLVKYGSGGEPVRRLQRALDASGKAGLEVDGVFARKELRAVRHFQARTGLPRTGVVTDRVWHRLQRGRTVPRRTTARDLGLDDLLDRVRERLPIPHNSGAAPR